MINSVCQEPISGRTDAEAAPSRCSEKRRLQCAAIAHLSTIAALSAGHLHDSGGHAVALDPIMLHPELLAVLARLRGDLVADRLHPR